MKTRRYVLELFLDMQYEKLMELMHNVKATATKESVYEFNIIFNTDNGLITLKCHSYNDKKELYPSYIICDINVEDSDKKDGDVKLVDKTIREDRVLNVTVEVEVNDTISQNITGLSRYFDIEKGMSVYDLVSLYNLKYSQVLDIFDNFYYINIVGHIDDERIFVVKSFKDSTSNKVTIYSIDLMDKNEFYDPNSIDIGNIILLGTQEYTTRSYKKNKDPEKDDSDYSLINYISFINFILPVE